MKIGIVAVAVSVLRISPGLRRNFGNGQVMFRLIMFLIMSNYDLIKTY